MSKRQKKGKHDSMPDANAGYQKQHDEYDNRNLISGSREAPKSLAPMRNLAQVNVRSMKNLDRGGSSSNQGGLYNNNGSKISVLQKPVRVSQNLPPKPHDGSLA